MDTALLSPEQTAALKRARQANIRPRPPSVPEFKLCQNDMENVKAGDYYIKTYDPETKENVITVVGSAPKVVILHRAYSYSYYDDADKELKAWTNEFAGFTDLDKTFLFAKKDSNAVVEFQGGYRQLKKYISENYCFKKGANVVSLMKFRNVLYVLYEGKPYRMFVSNASVAGIDPDTGKPSFENPQPQSFQVFCNTVSHSDENAFFGHVCQLGSIRMKPSGKPEYSLMTFDDAGQNDGLAAATDIYMRLIDELDNMLQSDVERMSMTTVQKETVAEVLPNDLPQFD